LWAVLEPSGRIGVMGDLTNLDGPEWTATEREVTRLRIDGLSCRKIAAELGMTFQNVALHLAKPHVRAVLNSVAGDTIGMAKERLLQRVPDLIDTELSIALGEADATPQQVRALQNALDRAGLAATKKTEVSGTLTTQTPDMAAIEAERARLAEERAALLAELGRE